MCDSLHVSELVVPEGTDLVSEGALTVATVLVPRGLRDSAKGAEDEAGEETGESSEEASED